MHGSSGPPYLKTHTAGRGQGDIGGHRCRVPTVAGNGHALPWAGWVLDAAPYKSLFVVGLWGQDIGYCMWQTPNWVQTQQVAELFGLHEAIKLAACRGKHDIDIVGDNVATLQQVTHQRARAPPRLHQRILPNVHHTMRPSGVTPRMY